MEIPHYRLALVKDGVCQSALRTISHPTDAFALVQSLMGDADRERVYTLMLDTRHRLIGLHQVSVGSLNASLVHPRETFKAAFLCNAAAIILAHCHPSGESDPSPEDLALTARIKGAGELLGVPLLDHLIVTDATCISLKTRGLL